MTDRRDMLKSVLQEIIADPQVMGAALVSRDGLLVLDAFKRPVHKETFGAMTATLLGAAEVAIGEAGGPAPERVTIDAGDMKMVVSGLSGDLILVVLADAKIATERLLPRLATGAAGIARLVSR